MLVVRDVFGAVATGEKELFCDVLRQLFNGAAAVPTTGAAVDVVMTGTTGAVMTTGAVDGSAGTEDTAPMLSDDTCLDDC